jgi:hypothetical protein
LQASARLTRLSFAEIYFVPSEAKAHFHHYPSTALRTTGEPMKTNPNKLWTIVLALGWLFDFLFWRMKPGVNFAIFSAACVTAAFYLLLSGGLRPNRASLSLIPLFGFFAAVTFIRAEPMTTFLAYIFTLLTMTLLALTYLGGRWIQYDFVDYLAKTASLAGSMIARPIAYMAEVRKGQAEGGVKPSKRNIWPVVRGILIALPVVAVFASLLASADAVFGQRLEEFVNWFRLDNLPELIFRFFYIFVVGYALAGVILHAATQSKDEKLAGEDKPLIPPFLGSVEAFIVLGSVVALFAVFVMIQFQYFFGGETNINVEGYTYAEYARRGFGELVMVAFFSLLMLMSLTAVAKRETEAQRKLFSGLGAALVALLLVMLFSAFKRLSLYEAAYGFSRLRTYTHVFLIWIGLLLVATIALEIFRKERLFPFALLIASLGFAASLPILNVDAFIVRQNIQRELHPQTDSVELDAQYFLDLSDDAVPELAAAYRNPSLPAAVHEQVGAALACLRHKRGFSENQPAWQSFHFAALNAERALTAIAGDLTAFKVDDDDFPIFVVMPSGKTFYCAAYYFD